MEEEVKIEEMNMGMKTKDFKFSNILWNPFETEIDQVQIIYGSKFSYLKEFIFPKVRFLIGGLLIAPEGYSRAKSI